MHSSSQKVLRKAFTTYGDPAKPPTKNMYWPLSILYIFVLGTYLHWTPRLLLACLGSNIAGDLSCDEVNVLPHNRIEDIFHLLSVRSTIR